ncbi:hypothetical protein RvY_14663-2 [Ramazzottius varieornatus]|uniref:Uncharacterized protein n=1 Tax=Ramazzottius varieornatus TaxID=947166 RepID=A0A1D1VTY9_RAMVA|nr:hypothetical protein RvY_14663-2 [Ramazzottius varieornatus]
MDILGLVIALFFVVLLLLMFVVFPPQEFGNIGLTFEQLVGGWLGDEQVDFVSHTIRQLTAVMVFHSALPFLAYLLIRALDPSYSRFAGESVSSWVSHLQTEETEDSLNSVVSDSDKNNAVSIICWVWSAVAVSVFCLASSLASYYRSGPDSWSKHPVAITLRKFSETLPFGTWHDVANDINREYQEVDKFVTMLSGWNVRTVATQSWILRLGRYRMSPIRTCVNLKLCKPTTTLSRHRETLLAPSMSL